MLIMEGECLKCNINYKDSFSAFPKMNMISEPNRHKETKALPLQTETKLMLDTVWKDHQVGTSLKISKRQKDIFNIWGYFTTLHYQTLPCHFHVDSEVSHHSKSLQEDLYKMSKEDNGCKEQRAWLIQKNEPYKYIQCIKQQF